jgi:hypothetical protein
LLRQALNSGRSISVTTSSGKVYIGKVTTNFHPVYGPEAIVIFLSRSGYRSSETQEVTLNIDYSKTHQDIETEARQLFRNELARVVAAEPSIADDIALNIARRRASRLESLRNFEIIIPISEVRSINFFDEEIYDRYFAPDDPTPVSPPPAPLS